MGLSIRSRGQRSPPQAERNQMRNVFYIIGVIVVVIVVLRLAGIA